jgi:hypothetical protein
LLAVPYIIAVVPAHGLVGQAVNFFKTTLSFILFFSTDFIVA